jgi:hypothetical protein
LIGLPDGHESPLSQGAFSIPAIEFHIAGHASFGQKDSSKVIDLLSVTIPLYDKFHNGRPEQLSNAFTYRDFGPRVYPQ